MYRKYSVEGRTFGDGARILIKNVDVKTSARQVPVEPDGAAVLGYVRGQYLIVDLRLQDGGWGSPGLSLIHI